jgi:hypothetical protein
MTDQEFDNHRWSSTDKVKVIKSVIKSMRGQVFSVSVVDFRDRSVAVKVDGRTYHYLDPNNISLVTQQS